MSSMQLVKDDEGQSYIPPSQRPDGTWRKPIRVRDGYVPQDEQPVYVSKGRQPEPESSRYPVGLGPADISQSGKGGFSVGYFDIGNYTPTAAIPGLNFVESSSGDGVVGTKSKSKKSKNKGQEGSTTLSTTTSKQQGQSVAATSTSASSKSGSSGGEPSQPQTDPVKRLRNLRKRLKEIEELEKKIMAGDLSNPEKEQLEKLKRKDEVQDEIDELENLVSKLNVS